jgi:hypothetical protein
MQRLDHRSKSGEEQMTASAMPVMSEEDRWILLGADILEIFCAHGAMYQERRRFTRDTSMTRAEIHSALIGEGWDFAEWELDEQLEQMISADQIEQKGGRFQCVL